MCSCGEGVGATILTTLMACVGGSIATPRGPSITTLGDRRVKIVLAEAGGEGLFRDAARRRSSWGAKVSSRAPRWSYRPGQADRGLFDLGGASIIRHRSAARQPRADRACEGRRRR